MQGRFVLGGVAYEVSSAQIGQGKCVQELACLEHMHSSCVMLHLALGARQEGDCCTMLQQQRHCAAAAHLYSQVKRCCTLRRLQGSQ